MSKNIFFCFALITNILILSCKNRAANENYNPTYSSDSSHKIKLSLGLPNLASYGDCDLLVKYLNKNMRTAQIRIITCNDADDYLVKLKNKSFDFTLINGQLIFDAEENGYSIVGKMGDDDKYKSVIFVRKDSAIHNFSDLKGKTLCTSGPSALAGTMMPELFLHKNGVNGKKDVRRLYAISFESTIMNVFLGRCAAGAAKKASVINALKERPGMDSIIAIKWETPQLINNALLITRDMDKAATDELLKLILGLQNSEEGRKALLPLDVSKFVRANSNTYMPLKEFLKEYNDIRN